MIVGTRDIRVNLDLQRWWTTFSNNSSKPLQLVNMFIKW